MIAWLWDRLNKEPAMALRIVQAAMALLVSYGFHATTEQTGSVLAFTAALLSFVTRQVVTPNAKL